MVLKIGKGRRKRNSEELGVTSWCNDFIGYPSIADLTLKVSYNINTTMSSRPAIDKAFIRRRLAWITTAIPEANPSRSTLQAVNSFLIRRAS